jgi:hypothetical protein
MSTCPCPTPTPSSRRLAEVHALSAQTPLLFLPVYIETRFIDAPDGSPELRVRVFPDQISINSHEPELTDQEITDGQAYWAAVWSAGTSATKDALLTPWRDLASRYGARRAAWIARELTPCNLTEQPASGPKGATLTLTLGSASLTFAASRVGAGGNNVQIAVDASSTSDTPVVVSADLVTIYAKWDGKSHTTTEIARYFPTTSTPSGGKITAAVAGNAQPLTDAYPTNLSGGTDPAPQPNFPCPPKRKSSWEKPAFLDALPDRWIVVLKSGTTTRTVQSENPIQLDLAISLDPNGGEYPAGSPVDSRLQWLVDFELAFEAGMALKIPLKAGERQQGVDRLFVYGVRSRDSSPSDTFADLLDAHHYTDGLSFVPQGAHTNNTVDASSAYSRKDLDDATSFAVERNGPLIGPPDKQPEADGNRFATLLGFDPARVENIQYAGGVGCRNASDMITALWPATLGYFLSQVLSPNFPPEQIEPARQWVLNNALPRGAFPAFRVGHTPYGVLPVTALARYKYRDSKCSIPADLQVEPRLAHLVRQLWPTWLASAANAPHMQSGGDPDKELTSILGMDASSVAFRFRPVWGNEFLWNYMDFAGLSRSQMNAWWSEHFQRGRTLLDSYGYNEWDPRAIHFGFTDGSFPVFSPTVQSGPLSELDTLRADAVLNDGSKVNYIQWLLQASVEEIRTEKYPGQQPTALLYKILRQSLILEYAKLASTSQINAGTLDRSQLREAELIQMGTAERLQSSTTNRAQNPVSVWHVLDQPLSSTIRERWSEYLVRIAPQENSPLPELHDLYVVMRRLAQLPTAELDRLFTETLDACSHRLDVWATAIANALLKRARCAGVSGVHLGCYGWVENLRPAIQPPQVRGTELGQVAKLDERRAKILSSSRALPIPLQPSVDNGGFIYAPSQDQAAVAAILRSGYMSHKGGPDEKSLSIDLSSERVRGALELLEGIQQGQSLNALLGYLFEAGLHDLKLDKYVQGFRNLFPMAANQAQSSTSATESVGASNVVDGVALRAALDNGQLNVGDDWGQGVPGSGNPAQNTIVALLRTLDGYAEALGELSIAEAVFQTVRGNFERGGGLMGAIAKGQRPPDPEVLRTPRGGLDITHRMAWLFAGTRPPNRWQKSYSRARAVAEPWLDAWLSSQLPDPATVGAACTVTYHDSNAGDHQTTVTIDHLNLSPLDCVAMAGESTQTAQRSELENRILYAAAVPYTADPNSIKINHPPSSATSLSFPDLLYIWKVFRMLIGGARPLTPQDMALPDKKVANADQLIKRAELLTRAKSLLNVLNSDLQALSDSQNGVSGAKPLPEALMASSFYSIPGSVPLSNSAQDPKLKQQADFVIARLREISGKASTLVRDTATTDDLLQAFATIFGRDFKVLPLFAPPDEQAVKDAFSKTLVPPTSYEPIRWVTQMSYVRPAMGRLDLAMSMAEVGNRVSRPQLRLAQLPAVDNDQWLALPWTPDNPPGLGRVSIACFSQGNPATDDVQAGMLIDEWLDKVPSTDERAAVAFHYEEPKSRPPQGLLLGVCPDGREFWDDDLVGAILEEAFELTKIRTVDLYSLERVGQVLPALYFPFNLHEATISTNFFAIAGGAL